MPKSSPKTKQPYFLPEFDVTIEAESAEEAARIAAASREKGVEDNVGE